MIAFKILKGTELASLVGGGPFAGTCADLEEGFIHLSTADQIDRVAQKHYSDVADTHLVAVDLDTLGKGVKWEKASNGQMYPHLYGVLNLSNVINHSPLTRYPDGSLEIPEIAMKSGS